MPQPMRELPASLTDVTVPLSVDPMTGKTFGYKLDGMTAIIDGKAIPTNTGPQVLVRGASTQVRLYLELPAGVWLFPSLSAAEVREVAN